MVPPVRTEASVLVLSSLIVTEAKPPRMPPAPNARASASTLFDDVAVRSNGPPTAVVLASSL